LTRYGRKHLRENITGYLFILPALVVMSIFVFWPVGYSFYLSFFNWDYAHLKSPQFIGLGNYITLFQLDSPPPYPFYEALAYTTVYVSMTALVVCAIFLFIDAISERKLKFFDVTYVFGTTTVGLLLLKITLSSLHRLPFLAIPFGIGAFCLIFFKKRSFISKMFEHSLSLVLAVFLSYAILRFVFPSPYGIYQWLDVIKDNSDFIKSLWNTAYYVILYVPTDIVLALLVALLLNHLKWFKALMRTSYFMPFVTSIVAISLVWQWIYNDQFGLLNYALSMMGLPKIAWLKNAAWTIPTIAIMSIWKTIGYNAIIFLAGLQSIDSFYYEAADIDGATNFQKFRYITWPLLSPMTFFVLIVSSIGAFKVFTQVYVLYQAVPGPYNRSGLTIVYYIFNTFYGNQQMGLASAAAYILFGIILVFTLLQFKAGRKRVEYI